MTGEEADKMLEKIAANLGEHFEAVQLLVTWTEDGGTYCAKRGIGNWYARKGMAQEMINHDVAQENAQQMAEMMNQD